VIGLQAVTEKPGFTRGCPVLMMAERMLPGAKHRISTSRTRQCQVVAPRGRRHLRDMSRHGLLEFLSSDRSSSHAATYSGERILSHLHRKGASTPHTTDLPIFPVRELLQVWADCLLDRATDASAAVRGPRWTREGVARRFNAWRRPAFTADARGRAGTPR
jgi:hypothetical protein